uniref:Uncharacterized protein n=1 Tax=Arundo donax TaxID=35708 RepID=A0A0A9GBB3_ARUDO
MPSLHTHICCRTVAHKLFQNPTLLDRSANPIHRVIYIYIMITHQLSPKYPNVLQPPFWVTRPQ